MSAACLFILRRRTPDTSGVLHVRAFRGFGWGLESPAVAIASSEEGVGFLDIGDGDVFGVPEEFSGGEDLAEFDAQGDITEEDDFCEGAGPIEVGGGGAFSAAGFDPFLVVAGGAPDGLRDFSHFISASFGEQSISEDEALGSDDEASVIAHEFPFGKVSGAGWAEAAVVPDHFYFRAVWLCGELVSDGGGEGEGLVIDSRGGCLDADGVDGLGDFVVVEFQFISVNDGGAEF